MNPERWRQIEELFHAALERTPERRPAFLDGGCRGDLELRREVESLLAREQQAGSFLEAPAFEGPAMSSTRDLVGRQFGPYKVISPLGAGGMGEVYRAHDSQLTRDVAIKTLPEEFAHDPERLSRLRREARTLASLNHPNVAAIYGLEESDGATCLVLELVEGEMLRGPLPAAKALEYARQVAEALEAAHQKGIIHRDLKPANVKVTPEGRVKVLDFGLAKAIWGTDDGQDPSGMATLTGVTLAGHVVGTPSYMSPEQARGQAVDEQTDVWAFGCLLYELLSGKKAFGAANIQEAVASVMERQPDWQALPAATPKAIRGLLERCLEKDTARRLTKIGVARAAIEQAQRGTNHWQLATVVVGLLLVVAIGMAFWLRGPARPPDRSQWEQITNFPGSVGEPALSRDGRMLTFIRGVNTFLATGEIYVKMLPSGDPVQLTHDNLQKMSPAFSPDGSRIAYTALNNGGWDTWVVPVLGGAPQPWLTNASGLTWIDPQHLLFSEIKYGQHMAIVAARENRTETHDVYVPPQIRGMAHRSSVSPDAKSVLLVEMDEKALWIPCRVVPLDGHTSGLPVGPPGGRCANGAWSPDGKYIYMSVFTGGGYHIWRQRFPSGKPEQLTSGPSGEEGIAMAPDGHSLITSVGSLERAVYVHDRNGDHQISREGYAYAPRFTADGKKLFFRIIKNFMGATFTAPSELWAADVESGQNEVFLPGFAVTGYDVSPDGRRLVFSAQDSHGHDHLWITPVDRRTPPQRVPNADGNMPFFGPPEELIFHGGERNALRIREDGRALRKAIPAPVEELHGVSPDFEWLIGVLEDSERKFAQAYSLSGDAAIPIGPFWPVRWQSGGKLLYLSVFGAQATSGAFGRNYSLPLTRGRMFPNFPPDGFSSEREIANLPGARLIDVPPDFTPGPTPEIYAFSRQNVQRNLYRIKLN